MTSSLKSSASATSIEPLEPPVQHRRALPAHDEAVDPGLLGPGDVLLHHPAVVARVAAEERIVDLGAVPGAGVEPDVVVGEQPVGPARPRRRRSRAEQAAPATTRTSHGHAGGRVGRRRIQQRRARSTRARAGRRDVEPADHLESTSWSPDSAIGRDDEMPSASTRDAVVAARERLRVSSPSASSACRAPCRRGTRAGPPSRSGSRAARRGPRSGPRTAAGAAAAGGSRPGRSAAVPGARPIEPPTSARSAA